MWGFLRWWLLRNLRLQATKKSACSDHRPKWSGTVFGKEPRKLSRSCITLEQLNPCPFTRSPMEIKGTAQVNFGLRKPCTGTFIVNRVYENTNYSSIECHWSSFQCKHKSAHIFVLENMVHPENSFYWIRRRIPWSCQPHHHRQGGARMRPSYQELQG